MIHLTQHTSSLFNKPVVAPENVLSTHFPWRQIERSLLGAVICFSLMVHCVVFGQGPPPSVYSLPAPAGTPSVPTPPSYAPGFTSSPGYTGPANGSPGLLPPPAPLPTPRNLPPSAYQAAPVQPPVSSTPTNPYPTPQVYGSQPNYGNAPAYGAQPGFEGAAGFGGAPAYSDPTGFPGDYPPAVGGPPTYVGPTERTADLIVEGFPARTGRIMFGGAVNSDAGVTGQVTVDERNFDITRFPRSFQDLISGTAFRGAGQTFRIEAVPGNLFQRYTVSFADPNLLGYLPISMAVSGFYYDRRFDDWDEGRIGGRLSFGYRITPDLSLSTGVSGQNVEISRPQSTQVAELNEVVGSTDLFSGLISLIHDTRNSPLQPSEGHLIRTSFEQTFGEYDYPRVEAEYRTYWGIRERADGSGKQTISYGVQLGYSGTDTPLFENFFAGGYATLRGFDFRGASPTTATTDGGLIETGGKFQFLNSVEYMFPITADDAFRGVAFVDFGTVERELEINAENFRVAPGFGVRVAIPMLGPAPLAFDFAFPIAKADFDDERIFTFYMSAIR